MEVISQVASSIFIREAMTASKRPSGLLSVWTLPHRKHVGRVSGASSPLSHTLLCLQLTVYTSAPIASESWRCKNRLRMGNRRGRSTCAAMGIAGDSTISPSGRLSDGLGSPIPLLSKPIKCTDASSWTSVDSYCGLLFVPQKEGGTYLLTSLGVGGVPITGRWPLQLQQTGTGKGGKNTVGLATETLESLLA